MKLSDATFICSAAAVFISLTAVVSALTPTTSFAKRVHSFQFHSSTTTGTRWNFRLRVSSLDDQQQNGDDPLEKMDQPRKDNLFQCLLRDLVRMWWYTR